MATAYKPLGAYNDAGVSAQDKQSINALSQKYESQKQQFLADGAISANEQSALDSIHSQAEAIRGQYGYSGGVDGSDYIRLEQEVTKNPIRSASSQADYINQLYAKQQEAALAKLKAAYDKNVIDLNAAAEKIPATYQSAKNQTAATAAQSQRAFNERAAASGISSGAGSQVSLAMSNQLQSNLSNISAQQAEAVNDLETQRLQLSTAYNNAVAQAVANGQMEKAAALYQEAVRVDNSLVAQAQAQADENYRYQIAKQEAAQNAYKIQKSYADTLAAYGDFSGYLAMGYPESVVALMASTWAAKNPLLAQAQGITTATTGNSAGGGISGGVSNSGSSAAYDIPAGLLKQISSNRTEVGVINTLRRLVDSGQISEAQAAAYMKQHGIDGGKQ